MAKGIKGVITDSDKQKFMRELYEENATNKLVKKIEEAYAEDYHYDDCPYCRKPFNFGSGARMGELPNKWIVAICPHCKNEVWAKIKMVREGDLFEGFTFTQLNQLYKKEEIPKKAAEVDTGERVEAKKDEWLDEHLEEKSPIVRRFKTEQ